MVVAHMTSKCFSKLYHSINPKRGMGSGLYKEELLLFQTNKTIDEVVSLIFVLCGLYCLIFQVDIDMYGACLIL
jgi:hypothetical protein